MMLEKVLNAIERFSLINKGDNITVALSGGADSVALLHALWSLKDRYSLTLKAAHLNHMIRGGEADRDEAFVKFFCDKLDIPIVTEQIDVPKIAKENHQSLELAAREVRYDFLKRNSDGLIATAHTASDNVETLILNLTRGSGLKGLCGIPPKRDEFIRPLILCSRADVEEYCALNSLSFVTDSTNLRDDYNRNRIRHNAVSTMRYINPSLEETISRTVDTLNEDNSALDFYANEVLFKALTDDGLLTDELKTAPTAVAKRAIVKYAGLLYNDLSLDCFHVNALYEICLAGGKTSLPDRLYGKVENGVLIITDGEQKAEVQFFVELINCDNVNNLLSIDLIDCDKIVGELKVRTRKEGDSIRLKNRGCTKTLNKLFTENKISPDLRDSIPVVCDDLGVVWVYGMGVSQRCSPTSSSKNCVEVRAGVLE